MSESGLQASDHVPRKAIVTLGIVGYIKRGEDDEEVNLRGQDLSGDVVYCY
jgi:hypothetical protein